MAPISRKGSRPTAAADRFVRRRAVPVKGSRIDAALLALLSGRDRPLSAYDLAAELRSSGEGMAIMSVYRALDRLVVKQLIQKVETLSAYRLRDQPRGMLLICIDCGSTASLPVLDEHQALMRAAGEHGFQPTDMALEARGRCAACQSNLSNEQPAL